MCQSHICEATPYLYFYIRLLFFYLCKRNIPDVSATTPHLLTGIISRCHICIATLDEEKPERKCLENWTCLRCNNSSPFFLLVIRVIVMDSVELWERIVIVNVTEPAASELGNNENSAPLPPRPKNTLSKRKTCLSQSFSRYLQLRNI